MRGALFVTCCWPGLSRLWLRGDPAGLLPAVAFAAAINAALWFNFGNSRELSVTWVVVIWLPLAAVWLFSAWRSYRRLPELLSNEPAPEAEGLFQQAQTEYLKGHWFEAEGLALQIARQFPRDVEGRLLLASLYRQMNRFDEARGQLQALTRLAGSSRWGFEIQEERRRLDQLEEERDSDEHPEIDADSPESTAKAA